MPLTVNVGGNRVVVGVSDGGMFHDKTMKFHATTLKSLEKKMNGAPTGPPPQVAIPVEHSDDLRQGVVTGKINGKYKVRWADGKKSTLSYYKLRRPMTPAQREQLVAMEQAQIDAWDVANESERAYEEFEASFDIHTELSNAFGS